jgi:hypothetical protein
MTVAEREGVAEAMRNYRVAQGKQWFTQKDVRSRKNARRTPAPARLAQRRLPAYRLEAHSQRFDIELRNGCSPKSRRSFGFFVQCLEFSCNGAFFAQSRWQQ